MSKAIRECFAFNQLCSVIGPETSHHPPDQLDAKLKPFAFSRAQQLVVFTLSSHLANDSVDLCYDWLILIFRNLIENCYHKNKSTNR